MLSALLALVVSAVLCCSIVLRCGKQPQTMCEQMEVLMEVVTLLTKTSGGPDLARSSSLLIPILKV